MSTYYQPSNRLPLLGGIGLLLLGSTVATVLAFVYVYAVWYIPFIYINVILTLAFGFLLGVALKAFVRVGQLRSPGKVGWLAVVVGLWAEYVQWAVYTTLLLGAGEVEKVSSRYSFAHTNFDSEMFLSILSQPADLLALLPKIADEGTWSIFGVGVSGVFLWLIWLLEAAIIIVLPKLLAQAQAREPYSELTNEWAEKITLPASTTAFADVAATKAALEAADWEHLQLLPIDSPTSSFGRMHLYQAPNDSECCYLSLENITLKTDDKGKTSESTADVLEYLRVSPQICGQLQNRFGRVGE